jgi:hypothetical protein
MLADQGRILQCDKRRSCARFLSSPSVARVVERQEATVVAKCPHRVRRVPADGARAAQVPRALVAAELAQGGASSLPSCEGIPPYGMAQDGGVCALPGQRCLCPDERRSPDCLDVATCDGDGKWQVEISACPPPEPETCPNDPLEFRDARCTAEGLRCPLTDPSLACYCINASSVGRDWIQSCTGYPPIWYCGESQSGCPEGVPEVGSPCSEEGVSCGDGCWNSLARECSDGRWVEGRAHGECI